MDFLVAGLGFGALLVIAGYAVREVGVYLFVPARVRNQFREHQELADAWRRMIRSASNTAMACGVAMWLVALIAVAVNLSDSSGAIAMASAATIVSLVGAGIIVVAQHQMHAPAAQVGSVRPVARPMAQPQPAATSEEGPLDDWRPRVIGRASSTIADDMPAWGAIYMEEAHAEPEPVEPASIDGEAEQVEASETVAESETVGLQPAETESEPGEVAIPSSSESEPVEAINEATAASEAEPATARAAEAIAAEADSHGELQALEMAEEATPGRSAEAIELAAVDVKIDEAQTVEAAEPLRVEAELAENPVEQRADAEVPAPIDEVVISEQPAPESRSMADQAPAGSRRFKSSLLADIDENAAAESNAAFKSSVLADLSGVRLPDDVPRFRSTTLIESPARDESGDTTKQNNAPNRRR